MITDQETIEEKPVAETTETEAKAPETEVSEQETQDKKIEEKAGDKPPEKQDQRRWERLIAERAANRREAEMLRAQLNQVNQQKQQQSEGRPNRTNYNTDEEYNEALLDWKLDQKISGVKQDLVQTQVQTQNELSWSSKVTQAKKSYEDWDDVMEEANSMPVNPAIGSAVADALRTSEYGPDIQYYLAKNPDELDRINGLSAVAAVRELGRIESYIEYEKDQAKPKAQPVSKAPNPIKPVKTSGAAQKNLEDLSPADFIALRNKQDREKRKK